MTDETVEIPPGNEYDAVRTDGGLVHIRPAVPVDEAALLALDHRVSDRSIYYRFFSPRPRLTSCRLPTHRDNRRSAQVA